MPYNFVADSFHTKKLCSRLSTVSWTIQVQCPTCSTPQLESYCVSSSSTTSPLTFDMDYIGCPFSRELNIKCVSWCTSVYIRLHQHTSLNCVHRCLNQPIVVTSVQLLGVPCSSTLQNNEIRPKIFCCFWSNILEFTPIVCS